MKNLKYKKKADLHFKYRYLVFFFLVFFTLSLNAQFYSAHHPTLIELGHQYDLQVDIAPVLNTSRKLGYRINAGFSPKEHIGVQANYQRIFKTNFFAYEGSIENSGELSIGYYHRRKSSKSDVDFQIYDIYFGGLYSQALDKFDSFGFSKYSYYKIFGQTGFHVIRSKRVKVTFTNRITYLRFSNVTILGDPPNFYIDLLENLSRENPFFFMEFSLKINYGFNWMKVFGTLTVRTFQYLNYGPYGGQIGLNFDLHEMGQAFKKSK